MRFGAGVLAVLLLAGCSDTPPAPVSDEPDPYGGLEATEVTGIIRGLVIDDAIRPIAGAQILLTPGDLSAQADAEGRFGFADLAPGFYQLAVSANGFQAGQQSVEVVAGERDTDIVKVQLISDPAALRYFQDFSWSGFIQSRFDGTVYGASSPDFQRTLQLDRKPTHITVELIWKSTQQVDRSLRQSVYWEGDDATMVQGESPLFQARGNETLQPGRGDPNSITVRVAGGDATLEQSYEVFIHVFYGYVPPADWRFSSGEPVPTP